MKKMICFICFITMIIFILFNSLEIMNSIRDSFSLCINNLFPSLIPFMLLSNILINYNFVEDISDILNSLMTKFFKVNKNCAFAFIMSIISGTPSNSKYIHDLYSNNLIGLDDCNNCLRFCHFTNPIFVLGTIGYTFLNDKKLGLIILICHYLGSIIIGLFNKKQFLEYKNCLKYKDKNKKNFIQILTDSIISTTNTLFLIMGIITTCLIITCMMNKVLNLNNNYKFLYGIIEITQGLKFLSLTDFNIKTKAIISCFMISFGGVCIHAQVFSIINNKKVRYIPYFISRIIHGVISSIFTYISIMVFY